jgi:hypothetical protein
MPTSSCCSLDAAEASHRLLLLQPDLLLLSLGVDAEKIGLFSRVLLRQNFSSRSSLQFLEVLSLGWLRGDRCTFSGNHSLHHNGMSVPLSATPYQRGVQPNTKEPTNQPSRPLPPFHRENEDAPT